MSNTTSSASGSSAPNPSEVGWQFVPQYYTFVNKQPHRLHCFYSKTSTFIHGTEGEDGRPCYGQQEIHNKILSIGFQDCKVFIHSVDAQASTNGGIIIQVIGEMSNKGEAWRKFVQTFFLAEQPNGYFVLNDIFRFLKEETVDDEESSEAAPEVDNIPPAVAEPAVTELTPPAPVSAPADTVSEVSAPPEITSAPVTESTKPQVNGYHYPNADKTVVDILPSPIETKTQLAELESVYEAEPIPSVPVVSPPAPTVPPSQPASPAPPPVNAAPASQPQAPPSAPSQPSSPPAPQAPKTWANLAATNSKKWGAAVAQESRGMSEAVAPTTPGTSAPPSGTQTPVTPSRAANAQGPAAQGRVPPAVAQANALTTPQVFIKGVVEPISDALLTQTLTTRFGPIKDIEIVRSRACAFAEFHSLDNAKRAIIASLPVSQGGEGGLRIDVGGEAGQIRIVVETKKERGDRPPPRPRGGAPGNGDARGGFRGGRGGGRGGRGGGQQQAAK